MTLAKYSLLLLVVSGSLYAQQMSHPVMASRDDAFSSPRPSGAFPDTIDILAVMVQFQQDTDTRTSGDGRFVLSGPSDIIDPAPRNRQHFENHLTFAANYFRKVSRGKLLVRATVVDSVFTLPAPMQTYSPPREGSTLAVGNLARDTWQMVDASGRVPDFSSYDCFVVFHAGVGRDIDLVGILGYDPTPFDIPSLYLGLGAFRSYYGESYQGIPVSAGAFHITNTIVVPETESRTLPTATGEVLLELGINGLLCASVGNFLGLPDLFDTNTGRSGIGRFGLMDGQAIFSFAGVFPPEPSAWEKYWLGWIDPLAVPPGDGTLSLPAVSLSDSIYRIFIGPQEYFLVENRNRDPLRNGQTVTSVSNGILRTQVFPRDTAGFNAFDISALSGVITDVEDLDWSLPGGVDNNGTFFDGGILIWHIDETVIRDGLVSNGVNGNPRRRGVDLEEADGSQDIGQQYEFLSPGSGSEEGTPLDFWYAGNGSPVNRNIFSATSHPDTRSNTGGQSHITLHTFGARSPRMSVAVSRGDNNITPKPGFPKLVDQQLGIPSLSVGSLDADGIPEMTVTTTATEAQRPRRTDPGSGSSDVGKIWSWRIDGTPSLPSSSSIGVLARASAVGAAFSGAAAVSDLNNDTVVEVVAGETQTAPPTGRVNAYSVRPRLPDSLAEVYFSQQAAQQLVTSPVIADSIIALGGTGGRVFLLRRDGTVIDTVTALVDTSATVVGISLLNGSTFIITGSDGTVYRTYRDPNGGASSEDQRRSFGKQIAGPAVAGIIERGSSLPRILFATADGYLHAVDGQLNALPGFPVSTGGAISNPPALADVNNDGSRDIIVFSGRRMLVYNATGAILDNFPITVASEKSLASAPVIADIDGDGDVDVIGVTEDGLVLAYDGSGATARGFPLQAGSGYQSVAALNAPSPLNSFETILVVASSSDGSISAWRTAEGSLPAPTHPWPQYQKDGQHSGLAVEPLTGTPLSSEFFPENRAYNWPNPVYDGRTFIRYFVKDDAAVSIKIFDLAGDLVTELAGPGVGGLDNEVEWNVGDVQSGVYFARIEASGAGGNGVAVVKVAVVK